MNVSFVLVLTLAFHFQRHCCYLEKVTCRYSSYKIHYLIKKINLWIYWFLGGWAWCYCSNKSLPTALNAQQIWNIFLADAILKVLAAFPWISPLPPLPFMYYAMGTWIINKLIIWHEAYMMSLPQRGSWSLPQYVTISLSAVSLQSASKGMDGECFESYSLEDLFINYNIYKKDVCVVKLIWIARYHKRS